MAKTVTPFLILSFFCFFSVVIANLDLDQIEVGKSYLMGLPGDRTVTLNESQNVKASSERQTPVQFYQDGNNGIINRQEPFQLACKGKYWKVDALLIKAENDPSTASNFSLGKDDSLNLVQGNGLSPVKIDDSDGGLLGAGDEKTGTEVKITLLVHDPKPIDLDQIEVGKSYLMGLPGDRTVIVNQYQAVKASSEEHTPVQFHQDGKKIGTINRTEPFQLACKGKYWKVGARVIKADDNTSIPASDFSLGEDDSLQLVQGNEISPVKINDRAGWYGLLFAGTATDIGVKITLERLN